MARRASLRLSLIRKYHNQIKDQRFALMVFTISVLHKNSITLFSPRGGGGPEASSSKNHSCSLNADPTALRLLDFYNSIIIRVLSSTYVSQFFRSPIVFSKKNSRGCRRPAPRNEYDVKNLGLYWVKIYPMNLSVSYSVTTVFEVPH